MNAVLFQETDLFQSPEALKSLYREAFPKVVKFVSKRGGSLDAAKDIFHDALLLFYEQVVVEGREEHYRAEAYVLGIAKHLWYKRIRKESNFQPISEDLTMETMVLESQEVSTTRLMQMLNLAGSRCMQLLTAFYYHKKPLETLMQSFGFSSPHSVSVQKYKCIEKIRNKIKEKNLEYESFFE